MFLSHPEEDNNGGDEDGGDDHDGDEDSGDWWFDGLPSSSVRRV